MNIICECSNDKINEYATLFSSSKIIKINSFLCVTHNYIQNEFIKREIIKEEFDDQKKMKRNSFWRRGPSRLHTESKEGRRKMKAEMKIYSPELKRTISQRLEGGGTDGHEATIVLL